MSDGVRQIQVQVLEKEGTLSSPWLKAVCPVPDRYLNLALLSRQMVTAASLREGFLCALLLGLCFCNSLGPGGGTTLGLCLSFSSAPGHLAAPLHPLLRSHTPLDSSVGQDPTL